MFYIFGIFNFDIFTFDIFTFDVFRGNLRFIIDRENNKDKGCTITREEVLSLLQRLRQWFSFTMSPTIC
jgi:hypothetical protein